MSSLNKSREPRFTDGGGTASHTNAYQDLRRSVLSTLLWEDQYYEGGEAIAERIGRLVPLVAPEKVHQLAVEARGKYNLRHVPLLLLCHCLKHSSHKKNLSGVISEVIQRPDELSEILAIYQRLNAGNRLGSHPLTSLASQLKKGLREAFGKFNEYSLAKYDQSGKTIKLKDVVRLVHPKGDLEHSQLYKKILDGKLETPDTWEVALSAGGPDADKKAIWTRLLEEKKLGALALLRNLRNMQEVKVDNKLIREALLSTKLERVLPFRFVTAARYAPSLEAVLEETMFKCLAGYPHLFGRTLLVVDVSGSMSGGLSGKSELNRLDAACALAMLVREVCDDPFIYATAGNDGTQRHKTVLVPPRRGFALRDLIRRQYESLGGGGIFHKQSIDFIRKEMPTAERIITFSDGQDTDHSKNNKAPAYARHNYFVNVGSYKNSVGYGDWLTIEGFSEGLLGYIQALEGQSLQ